MFKDSTLPVVTPVAQSITESNRRLVVKNDQYPLAVVASMYANPVEPNGTAFDQNLAVATEALVESANAVMPENASEEYQRITNLLGNSLRSITFNARNQIVPTVDALVERYNQRSGEIMAPKLEVRVFDYHDIHNDPRLVNHVMENYAQVQVKPSYRSFLLPEASAEQIISLVAQNNPHLDQEQVTDWLLHVTPDKLTGVWRSLFGQSRSLDPNKLDFLIVARLPETIDEIAVAYCLTGHLAEHPVEEPGESVALEEWSRALLELHQLFGAYLVHAYQMRAQAIQEQKLIIDAQARNPVANRSVSVLVNGDVYRDWLEAGGEVELLLGAAVYAPNLTTAPQLQERHDLIEQWHKLYPLIHDACLDHAVRQKRQIMEELLMHTGGEVNTLLPPIDYKELVEHVPVAMRQLSEEDLENPYLAFTKVVCQVYYPTGSYLNFLKAMNGMAKDHPGNSGRELALRALIEVTADWLAEQIKVETFTPLVKPAPAEAALENFDEAPPVEDEPILVEGLAPPAEQAPGGKWVTEYHPTDEHGELPPGPVKRWVADEAPTQPEVGESVVTPPSVEEIVEGVEGDIQPTDGATPPPSEFPGATTPQVSLEDAGKKLAERLVEAGCQSTRVRVLVSKDPESGEDIVGRYEALKGMTEGKDELEEAFDKLCQSWYLDNVKSDEEARKKVDQDLTELMRQYREQNPES